ncbi:hypothetical protein ACFPIA_00945 [Pediococcus cellicola]
MKKLNELQEVVERRSVSHLDHIADTGQTINKKDIYEPAILYIHDTSH